MSANTLDQLRRRMQAEGIDALFVPTADPHQSEYVAAHYQTRAFLTGFTGSSGTAVVTAADALLWTDGRYFIQAAKEILPYGFSLMKLNTPATPDPVAWLAQNLPQEGVLAFNGSVLSQFQYEALQTALGDKDVRLISDENLLEALWTERPRRPNEAVFVHAAEYAGESISQKLTALRDVLAARKADHHLLSSLENIAWLFNFRGRDVPHNPVAYAYAIVTPDQATLYLDREKTDKDFTDSLQEAGVTLRPYAAIREATARLEGRVLLEKQRTSRALFATLGDGVTVLDEKEPVTLIKAQLSPTEERNQRNCWIRDSVAVTRFLFWIRQAVREGNYDEWTAAEQLQAYRAADPLYLEDSFNAISAYGKNAPMMHYAAGRKTAARLQPRGFYLIDSGGQYLDGTTDVTRTVALGPLTPEQIRDYTLVLKAHIGLARAVFLEGVSGHYLDVLARQPLWQHRIDYKSGTGHALGYVSGVHEGPQRISGVPNSVALQENMMLSIEPGIYRENEYGIRLENIYLVKKDDLPASDVFLRFDPLTFVPFEREAIDVSLLDADELNWLNRYHREVERRLGPQLDAGERQLLSQETAPL